MDKKNLIDEIMDLIAKKEINESNCEDDFFEMMATTNDMLWDDDIKSLEKTLKTLKEG